MKVSILKTAFLTLFLSCFIFIQQSYADVTKTVGASGADYSTLKLAFDAINAGTIKTGVITLQIIDNTTESGTAVLYQSGYTSAGGISSYTSVKIYPTASDISITGNFDAPIITLNGADNVTIDGQLNATGSTKDLTITNTNTGANATTLQLENSAENNIVKYCNIKGSETSISKGVIFFSTSASGNGNDNNLIDNNNITSDIAGRPINAIYSLGATDFDNSSNTISNNNIYDFLHPNIGSNAINISLFNTAWIITGNSFYETSSFAPTANVAYSIIEIINASGNGFVVSDNFIGGNAPLCSGTFTKTTGATPFYNNAFIAIDINVGTSSASSLQNNTIKNFSWANSGSASWTAISIAQGTVNVGTTSGNSIGASTGTGSITVTDDNTNANIYGISIAGNGTISIQNNIIGSIIAANSDASFATNVYGIYRSNTGTTTISGNTIGSSSEANSIWASSPSTADPQLVYGIYNTTGGTTTINNNSIANLSNATTNSNTATAGRINGIASILGIITATNNTIWNLSIANANIASDNSASIIGITLSSSNLLNTITGNTIYNLSNMNTDFAGNVIGMYFGSSGTNHIVSSNFIHSLSVNVATSSASIYGIKINTGATTYSNNIISLGGNTTSTLYGIYEPGNSGNNNNLYYNTIYLSGAPASGSLNSFALYSADRLNTRNFRNNILFNARSNSGATGKHYGVYLNYGVSTALTLDYNNYYVTGTGGVLGYYNGSEVSSSIIISGFDTNSMSINPLFTNAGGIVAANYIPTSDKLGGFFINNYSTDYASATRASSPTIGAFEVTQNLNVDVYKLGVLQASYFKIRDAFDKINSGAHIGALELRVKANTNETASAILYQSGYTGAGGVSNYSSVNIYPTASDISITGNFDAPIITLNGADNVTLDGRVNGFGTTKSLTLTNLATSSGAVIVRYINTAETNTIKYCTLKASPSNNGTGIVYFTGSASVNGNNNNIVEYCDITNNDSARPINAIFSSGTSGRENKYNIIRYNNIYNAFSTLANSYNINISNSSSDWTISNNSFYETSTLVPTGAWKYYPIFVNTGNNHIVTNNYIGGSQAECGGTALTINASKPHYYAGIFINGGLVNQSTVENNIIRNMNYTSTNSNPWDGIFINSGNVDVIGNTIGAETGTGSIIITTPAASATATMEGGIITAINLVGGGSGYTSAPSITFSTAGSSVSATATANLTGDVVTSFNLLGGGTGYTGTPIVSFDGSSYSTSHGMIQNSAGVVNILNNITGSITTVGSATYSHGFESIYVRTLNASAVTNIQNNLYGSLTTANSIEVSSTAVNSPQKQDAYGIYSSSVGTTTISGNTVVNLTNRYEGINSGSKTRGIQTIAGTNTILNNTVRNLSTTSGNSGKKTSATIIGISQTSTTGSYQIVKGNKVYGIYNTNTNQRNNVIGIFFSGIPGGSNSVTENFVHSLSCTSSDLLSEIDGIVLFNGLTTTANNIVNIGTSISNGYLMYGIWDEGGATNNNSIYFNSVYLAGTVASGTTANTAALWNNFNTSTRNYRNNIFYNARTGGSAGKHYAIVLAGVANTTIDYNDYYYAGSVLGKIGTLERTNLTNWKTGTSQDMNSLNTDPGFTVAGSTTDTDYKTGVTVLPGVSVVAVTTDYANAARAITPKMGAYEGKTYTWTGVTNTDFATASNWEGTEVPPNGADISFAETPTNHCILDQNRTLRGINNAQASKNLVLNGKQLTLTGALTFTNSAKIDATTATSKIVFAGTTAQSIPSGSFVNNTVDSLAVNNASGLTLNGDFTIEKGIALMAGNFAIGANTLTFNGIVTALTGTVTGGTSTNMIIGGAGGEISMPAITLANLTINRVTGVNMIGNVNIATTVTLTNGTLTVGANTLTLSGTTPVRTSGTINASNAAASVVFANPTAITLPAALFTGDIQQLTLNSSAGVTAGGNLSVSGNLHLNAANPSDTIGLLDMDSCELEMKNAATTSGIGDVTGRIVRNGINSETTYTFGNALSTLRFYNATIGTMPTKIKFIVAIGKTHATKSNTIKRYYQIVRTGGSTPTRFTLNLHYLESELNGITESNLVFWDHHIPYAGTSPHEHGKTELNTDQNWISLSGHSIAYLVENDYFGELPYVVGATQSQAKIWMMSAKESISNYMWLGAVSSNWDVIANWSGSMIPTSTSDVIIPNNTPNAAKLPDNETREVKSINIETGGRMEGGTNSTLNVNGTLEVNNGTVSWLNVGSFDAGTSTVVFKRINASIAGNTNFYNITIPEDTCSLLLMSGSTTRVSHIFSKTTNSGFNTNYNGSTTFGYNGADQTVVLPLNSSYYNLELSGSGTKTMPASALAVLGNLSTSETTTTTAAAAITISGNITIGTGTTFNTGNFNHSIAGNFENNGTFNAAAGYGVIMNGAAAQTIGGTNTTNFDKLTINNSAGVSLFTNENVSNELILTAGNLNVGATTLGINGTISKTSGLLNVSSLSSLNFGGSDALTLSNGLFSNTPSINNLTVNRSGGVTLGNQSMTVNGLLDLAVGTLTVEANTITLTGSSPTRTSGNIDASNAAATMAFANTTAIVLPASIFNANVNNFTITSGGTGGVTASSDFTINGVLSLQSVNPSDTKGSLEMTIDYGNYPDTTKTAYLDSHILTLGTAATTVGIGDVTGTVRRNNIAQNTTYTFGNQYTTVSLTPGTMPDALLVTTTIGTSVPAVNALDAIRDGVRRMYEIVPIVPNGYTSTSTVNANFHYLDSELTSSNSPYYTNTESNLVTMDYDIEGPSEFSDEHGRSTYDFVNNYIGLSNVPISYFINIPGHAWRTIFSLRDFKEAHYTWNGSESTEWGRSTNWTPIGVPSDLSHVIIPDISTTLYQCALAPAVTINTMTIENGGALTMGSETLTIKNSLSGGWEDQNTLGNNPGTSKVIFSRPGTTLSGTSRFYDVEIGTGADITNQAASTMKIANSITRTGTGKWYADVYNATIEYNGAAQTVALPDGTANYHNLTLSGSGVKTLPVSPLSIVGNLSLSGTASTTITDSVSVGGNLSLASGTSLTVSPAKILNIAGTITNNAGVNGLIIKSSSTLANGSLIFHNTYNSPVQATIEMYSKAFKDGTNKWQFFGIPVRTLDKYPTFYNPRYVRKYNETGTGSGTALTSRWIQLANGNTLTPFTGYEVTQNSPMTYTFSGELVNHDYSSGKLSYTYTSPEVHSEYPGQHLIGNPYLAAIDISKIEFGSDDAGIIENTVYLYNTGSMSDWTAASSGTPSAVESTTPGQYVCVPKATAGTNGLPSQIPSMQAFLVKAKSNNALATVSIPYSSVGTMVKNTSKQRSKKSENASTRIDIKGANLGDQMWLITEPTCTRGFDNGWDGYKILGVSSAPQLFAMEDTGDFQVNSVEDVNNTYLGFQAGIDANYTITFTHQNIESQYPALYLIDLMNNDKVTDITLSGSSYSFTASATGITEKRFKIVTSLGNVTATPVLNSKQLNVYSSNNIIFVQNPNDFRGDLVISDLTGKILQKFSFDANGITSLRMNLPAGAYIVKGKAGSEIVTESVILK